MIKFGQTSLLELPVMALKVIFPFLRDYYPNSNHEHDAYEHIYTGFILSLIFSFLMVKIDRLFILAIIVSFIVHVIVKEIIIDGPKHIFKGNAITDAEWRNFSADIILRCTGFVMGMPFVIAALFR